MPYWAQIIAWLIFWCALGLALRPVVNRSRGHK